MNKTTFTPFEKKVWLSSPTMHGPELAYVTEAYETNWMSTVGANINEVERWLRLCSGFVSGNCCTPYGCETGGSKTGR